MEDTAKYNTRGSQEPNIPSSADFSEVLEQYDDLLARLKRSQNLSTSPALSPSPIEYHTQDQPEKVTKRGAESECEESIQECIETHDEEFEAEVDEWCAEKHETAEDSPMRIGTTLDKAFPPPDSQNEQIQEVAPEAWEAFVFGQDDSDDVGQTAFDEARHRVARDLRPSDSPSFISDKLACDEDSNLTTAGAMTLYRSAPSAFMSGTQTDVRLTASRIAELGSSSMETENESDSMFNGPATLTRPSRVIEYISSSIIPESQDSPRESAIDGPTSMEMAATGASETQTDTASVINSMVAEPAQSTVGTTGPEQFIFARPRPFIGRRSDTAQPNRPVAARAPLSFAKKRRGRQKKRAKDGRMDIRAVPNYNSDPIEEIEDDDGAPPSIFGSLDVGPG